MAYKDFFASPKSEERNDSGKSYGYYKRGVKSKYPKKGQTLRMQILPAFNPDYVADPQSFVPCMENGRPTGWFGMIRAAKFVGHAGEGRDGWKDTFNVLSLESFDDREQCPYRRILDYCKNSPEWKYLVTKTGKWGQAGYQDAILKEAKSILLLNIVDVDNPGNGVMIGEFSYSVANDLLNPESGCVFQRNLQIDNYPNADQLLANNPMLAYANGDITDPDNGPVFVVDLPPVKAGQFGTGYRIRFDVQGGKVVRRRAAEVEMASRYHLDDPESFLNIQSGQEIVDMVVANLRGHKNPLNGVDESCMVRDAVGDTYRVDTVSAPGAVNTVQGWSADETKFASPQPAPQPRRPYPQTQPQTDLTPAEERVVTGQAPVQPRRQSNGFAPNPAVNAAGMTAREEQVVQGAQPIPGEGSMDEAVAIAARLKSQLNARRS